MEGSFLPAVISTLDVLNLDSTDGTFFTLLVPECISLFLLILSLFDSAQ